MNSFLICNFHQILFAKQNQRKNREGRSEHMAEKRNSYRVLIGKTERHNLNGIGAVGGIMLKRIFKRYRKMWTCFIWLKSDTWLPVVKEEKEIPGF